MSTGETRGPHPEMYPCEGCSAVGKKNERCARCRKILCTDRHGAEAGRYACFDRACGGDGAYQHVVACETCGEPTPMLGTRRCDGCLEVESRLGSYLRTAGGRAFVAKLLVEAPGGGAVIIKVVKVLEYVGEEVAVRRQLEHSVTGTIALPNGVLLTGVEVKSAIDIERLDALVEVARTEPKSAPWLG